MRFADAPVWDHLQSRIPHAMIVQGAAGNPYLQWILQGTFDTALPYALRPENYDRIRANIGALEWRCCAIEEQLRRTPTGSVDGFNLSDVFEYVSDDAYRALIEELVRVGSKGSHLVYWNVAVDRQCPASLAHLVKRRSRLAARLHHKDKAFFYRRLVVEEVMV